jgi:hypothetical protein
MSWYPCTQSGSRCPVPLGVCLGSNSSPQGTLVAGSFERLPRKGFADVEYAAGVESLDAKGVIQDESDHESVATFL